MARAWQPPMRPRAIARAGASATRATAAAAVAEGCTGSVCAAASAPGVTAVLGVTAELGVTAVLGVTAALQAKSASTGRLELLDFELVTRGLLPQQPLLTTSGSAPSMLPFCCVLPFCWRSRLATSAANVC